MSRTLVDRSSWGVYCSEQHKSETHTHTHTHTHLAKQRVSDLSSGVGVGVGVGVSFTVHGINAIHPQHNKHRTFG